MTLDALFKPSSIAVMGASRHKKKVENVVFRNLLLTFHGKLYPVNNKAEGVEGIKAYRSVKEVPDPVASSAYLQCALIIHFSHLGLGLQNSFPTVVIPA